MVLVVTEATSVECVDDCAVMFCLLVAMVPADEPMNSRLVYRKLGSCEIVDTY